MKLFFVLVFMILSHFSFAQIKAEKINSDVEELNKGLIHDVYRYDEATNTIYYQMYFLDEESFGVYTHFNSVESIFQNTFKKLNSKGVLERVNALGVVNVGFLIKSETTGDILGSKLLNLGVAKVKTATTLSLEEGS